MGHSGCEAEGCTQASSVLLHLDGCHVSRRGHCWARPQRVRLFRSVKCLEVDMLLICVCKCVLIV